jgi:hypothetical protein
VTQPTAILDGMPTYMVTERLLVGDETLPNFPDTEILTSAVNAAAAIRRGGTVMVPTAKTAEITLIALGADRRDAHRKANPDGAPEAPVPLTVEEALAVDGLWGERGFSEDGDPYGFWWLDVVEALYRVDVDPDAYWEAIAAAEQSEWFAAAELGVPASVGSAKLRELYDEEFNDG